MKENFLRLLAVVSVAFFMGACASFPGPSQSDWAKMSDSERAAAREEARQLAESFQSWWTDIGLPLYQAHQPVRIGTEENGYTIHWQSLPGPYDAVSFYPGHNPPGMSGNSSEGVLTALANKKGEWIYRTDGKGAVAPNKLLANVTTSEDVGRLVVKGLFQVGAAAANGSIAAAIHAADDCGENCGNINLTNVGLSSAGAVSKAVSGAGVDINVQGCTTGDCSGAF